MSSRKGKSGMDSPRSGPSIQATNATQSEHRGKLQELSSARYPDGTYDLETMAPIEYNKGYQVTFCQIGDNYSDAEYAGKVNDFLAISSDGKVSAGKFDGSPEVSFHCDDRATAMKLGKQYNQVSVWDWKHQTEISTGGTGKRSK